MTIEEYCQRYLEVCGMLPEDSEPALKYLKDKHITMMNRWSQPTSECSQQTLDTIRRVVNSRAIEWIDANCPKAWYRLMFTAAVAKAEEKVE